MPVYLRSLHLWGQEGPSYSPSAAGPPAWLSGWSMGQACLCGCREAISFSPSLGGSGKGLAAQRAPRRTQKAWLSQCSHPRVGTHPSSYAWALWVLRTCLPALPTLASSCSGLFYGWQNRTLGVGGGDQSGDSGRGLLRPLWNQGDSPYALT